MLASVVIFLFYINHIAQSIRVATIIASIGEDTWAVIERRHPPSSTNGTARGIQLGEERTPDQDVGYWRARSHSL